MHHTSHPTSPPHIPIPPLQELYKNVPSLKLLYVTPEQLARQDKLHAALDQLYQRGLLARIVIDEVRAARVQRE